mmetsp:Transcript_3158/g.5551  ORF Transcript_3158/g.5551 Transcript_3158/m.5551 type:complete len:171 (-) Transcript_3158:226-738(-)
MIQLLWIFVFLLSWGFSNQMVEQLYPRHDSLVLYKLPLRIIIMHVMFCLRFLKRVFREIYQLGVASLCTSLLLYQNILAKAVKILRKRNAVSEFLLIIWTFVWIFWPLGLYYYVSFFFHQTSWEGKEDGSELVGGGEQKHDAQNILKVPVWLLTFSLVLWSRLIILSNWG